MSTKNNSYESVYLENLPGTSIAWAVGFTSTTTSYSNILRFPTAYYPLENINQLVLHWRLDSLGNGTYVQVTPFGARGLVTPATTQSGSFPPVAIPGGFDFSTTPNTLRGDVSVMTFNFLDTTNSIVTPYPFTIKKTAIDTSS